MTPISFKDIKVGDCLCHFCKDKPNAEEWDETYFIVETKEDDSNYKQIWASVWVDFKEKKFVRVSKSTLFLQPSDKCYLLSPKEKIEKYTKYVIIENLKPKNKGDSN